MIVDLSKKDYYERSLLWSDFYAVTGAEISMIERLAPEETLDVLEIGCGNGRLTKQLAAIYRTVVGVDQDDRLLSSVEEKCRESGLTNIKLRIADAETLPFTNDQFDLVLMPWMLHQVKDKVKAITEAHRVLKPGGQLIIFGLLPDCDYDRIAHHFVPALDRNIDPETYYKEPIFKVFNEVQCLDLAEDEHSFCFLFPNCATAYEAFVFAFQHWYDRQLTSQEKSKLRRLIQGFGYGDQIRLQTKGLLLSARKR